MEQFRRILAAKGAWQEDKHGEKFLGARSWRTLPGRMMDACV